MIFFVYVCEKDANEIPILLGSDIMGKLLAGSVKQLFSDGLTAVNMHLGWTILGKSKYESNWGKKSLLVHYLLMNHEKIPDLGELNLLGIKDQSEK